MELRPQYEVWGAAQIEKQNNREGLMGWNG
jgi:hypothetical protein